MAGDAICSARWKMVVPRRRRSNSPGLLRIAEIRSGCCGLDTFDETLSPDPSRAPTGARTGMLLERIAHPRFSRSEERRQQALHSAKRKAILSTRRRKPCPPPPVANPAEIVAATVDCWHPPHPGATFPRRYSGGKGRKLRSHPINQVLTRSELNTQPAADLDGATEKLGPPPSAKKQEPRPHPPAASGPFI